MKVKIASIVFLLLLANFAQGQVKFRIKKLNADSLAALIPVKKGTDKIDALNILSNVICRKDPDSSMNLATTAIDLSEKLDYKKGLADGYFNVGNVWFLRDSLAPTISNYLKAYWVYEDLEPSEEYADLIRQINYVNIYTGRTDRMIEAKINPLDIYEKLGIKEGQFIVNYGMGFGAEDFDSSMMHFNRALAAIDPAVNCNEAAYVYCLIGRRHRSMFEETKDTTWWYKAFPWYYKARELPDLADDAKALFYREIVNNFLCVDTPKSLDSAYMYLQQAVKEADGWNGKTNPKYSFYRLLGRTTYFQGNYREAIAWYNKALVLIRERLSDFSISEYRDPILAYDDKYMLKVHRCSAYFGIFGCYTELGDYKTAHENYVLAKQAQEEIFLERNKNLITLMEVTSKDERAKSRIDLLARDNELQAMAIKQSRIIIAGIAGILIVLLLMGTLFLRQNKMKNEHKTVLLEQKLLRLQMNPHFIFNALSNILNFIDGKENEKASNYLTTFSKLLRTTLESTREDMVPFEKEVSSLRNYLELQKLRYKDKFEYHLEVDKNIEMEDMSIPPMLVQPFIENAIEHGIRHKKMPGRIDVRFFLKDKKILCEVEDDGVGREKAWEAEASERSGHKSLATEIIRDRIENLNKKFKRKIKLEIIDKLSENEEATGTKVLLDLPYGSVYD